MTTPPPPPSFPPTKRKLLPLWTGLGGLVLGGVLGAGIMLTVSTVQADKAEAADEAAEAEKRQAVYKSFNACRLYSVDGVETGDDATSATFTRVGKWDGPSMSDWECMADELGAPDSMRSQIGQTRALDGRQTATWDSYEASWTYHPDNGMSLVVRYVPPQQ